MIVSADPPRRSEGPAERLERACGRLIAGGGRVEELLRRDAELAGDPEAVLDLIDAEYCGRCDRGESPAEVAVEFRRRFGDLDGLAELLAIEPPAQTAAAATGEPVVSQFRTLGVLSPTARVIQIDAERPTQLYRQHVVAGESVDAWVGRQRGFREAADRLPAAIVTPHAVSVGDGVVHWMRPWVEGTPPVPMGPIGDHRTWIDAAWLLAALHAAGFYHGRIDRGIVVDHAGRPHLIDAMVHPEVEPWVDWQRFADRSGLSLDQLAEPIAAGGVG